MPIGAGNRILQVCKLKKVMRTKYSFSSSHQMKLCNGAKVRSSGSRAGTHRHWAEELDIQNHPIYIFGSEP